MAINPAPPEPQYAPLPGPSPVAPPQDRKRYLHDGVRLSKQAMRDHNLTEAQFAAAQAAISRYWDEMADKTSARIFLDEEASKSSLDNAMIYRLPALDRLERETMMANVEKALISAGGDLFAQETLAGLRSRDDFGRQGAYDIEFRILPGSKPPTEAGTTPENQASAPGPQLVEYTYSNPRSGGNTGIRVADLSKLSERFKYRFASPPDN